MSAPKPDSRMIAAAAALRSKQASIDVPLDRAAAELLERLAELAPYWHEPYAAPFVPIIESGVRLADAILGPAS